MTPTLHIENQDKWQPIETAPKDGTWVLLAQKHENHGWIMSVAHFFVARWYANGDTVVWLATHWMPLPAPPETGS